MTGLKTDAAVLAAFDAMIAGMPGVARKGATMPFVSINGNMFATINKANVIGIRLSEKDLATFFSTYGAKPFESIPGFVAKEYAAIPWNMLTDIKTMQLWFKLAHGYALRLPPNPNVQLRSAVGAAPATASE